MISTKLSKFMVLDCKIDNIETKYWCYNETSFFCRNLFNLFYKISNILYSR